MASTTTNLGLTKPAYTDSADVAVINSNMDILDTKIGAIGNTSVASQIGTLSEQIGALQGRITDASKGTINLNDYKSTGMYSYNGNTSSNTPSTGSCTLIVQKYSNDFVVQIVSIVRSTVTEMWVRNFYNGTTWSDWARLAIDNGKKNVYANMGAETKTFTLSNGLRAKISIYDSTANHNGEYFLFTTGAGAVDVKPILQATDITLDITVRNKLTVTVPSGSRIVEFDVRSGDVTV